MVLWPNVRTYVRTYVRNSANEILCREGQPDGAQSTYVRTYVPGVRLSQVSLSTCVPGGLIPAARAGTLSAPNAQPTGGLIRCAVPALRPVACPVPPAVCPVQPVRYGTYVHMYVRTYVRTYVYRFTVISASVDCITAHRPGKFMTI